MRPLYIPLCCALLAAVACTKEKPVLKASYHASCRACIVAYAVGPQQSHKDTLKGVVDPISGIPAIVDTTWQLEVQDGDNLFLRACQLDSVSYGEIDVDIRGDVAPMSAATTADSCAEINAPGHPR
jgi:hypothetical protein